MSHRHTVPYQEVDRCTVCVRTSLYQHTLFIILDLHVNNVTTCGIPVEGDGTISHEINSIQEKPGLSCYDVQERG